jgi:hypothetical protein
MVGLAQSVLCRCFVVLLHLGSLLTLLLVGTWYRTTLPGAASLGEMRADMHLLLSPSAFTSSAKSRTLARWHLMQFMPNGMLSATVPESAVDNSDRKWSKKIPGGINGASIPAAEEAYYGLFSPYRPRFVTSMTPGWKLRAKTMYDDARFTSATGVTLPADAQPEFNTQCFSDPCTAPQAYNGECKPMDALEQTVANTLYSMCGTAFRKGAHEYYTVPPRGLGLLAYGPMGVLVAVEMVGIAFVSFASKPFFLCSKDHKRAVVNAEAAFTEANARFIGRDRSEGDGDGSDDGNDHGRADDDDDDDDGDEDDGNDGPGSDGGLSQRLLMDLSSVRLGARCSERQAIRWTNCPHEGKFYKFIGGNVFGPAKATFPPETPVAEAVGTAGNRKRKRAEAPSSPPSAAQHTEEGTELASCLGEDEMAFAVPNAVFHAHRYKVYQRYHQVMSEACAAGDAIPASLLSARLLYGWLDVAVEMPFVKGRHPHIDEISKPPILPALVEAVMWLAKRRLLYIDIRPPNVLLTDDDKFFLIDYDDMVLLDEPLTSGKKVRKLMKANPVARRVLEVIPLLSDALKKA